MGRPRGGGEKRRNVTSLNDSLYCIIHNWVQLNDDDTLSRTCCRTHRYTRNVNSPPRP